MFTIKEDDDQKAVDLKTINERINMNEESGKETEDMNDYAVELEMLLEECQSKKVNQLASRKMSCGRGKVMKTLIEVLKPENPYQGETSVMTKDSSADDEEDFIGLAVPPLDDYAVMLDTLNNTTVTDLSTFLDNIDDRDQCALKSQKKGSGDDKAEAVHSFETKVQNSGKRLREKYDNIEISKKQRMIQVIDYQPTSADNRRGQIKKKNSKLAQIKKSVNAYNRLNKVPNFGCVH